MCRRGDPLKFSAGVWNYATDQYARSLGAAATSGPIREPLQSSWVLVKNTTADLVPKRGIIAYGDPINPPAAADDLDSEWWDTPLVTGLSYTVAGQYKWGIALEAIAAGAIGRVLISGRVTCLIASPSNVNFQFAQPQSSATVLTPVSCGIARIISRKAGTGPQPGLINIG